MIKVVINQMITIFSILFKKNNNKNHQIIKYKSNRNHKFIKVQITFNNYLKFLKFHK